MSGCTNCFNGCSEVTSDKCVKYTGVSIPSLEINNGDTLLSVETKIINYLLTALDGTGIIPYISPEIVSSYLPETGDINLVQIVDALFNITNDLQLQILGIENDISILNDDYDIGCLDEVISTSGTHDVLQATIIKLCELNTTLSNLSLNLSTNYVAISDVNTYIEAYLTSSSSGTLTSAKMIPYVAYEYYGPLSNFDVTGAGIGDWVNIYLCNGNNGTPDKRGRTTVGAIVAVGGGTLDAAVDPSTTINPNYALGDKAGANAVTLTSAQIPSHSHTASLSTDGAHTHTITGYIQSGSNDGSGGEAAGYFDTKTTSSSGSHTHTVTVDVTGGGGSHNNIQPTIAAYYIIYLP